jgi:N6-adenosine-specific RNA methylase IME4
MSGYSPHRFSEIFDMADAETSKELIEDIGKNGLLDPITLYEGMILDGRNRYAACIRASIPPRFVEFEGDRDAALAFVWSKNYQRRHLTEGAKQLASARMETLKHGQRPRDVDSASLTRKAISNTTGVSVRSIARANKVLEKGTPEIVKAVSSGRVSVNAAEKIVDLLPDQQNKIAADKKPAAAIKKIERAKKEESLGAKQTALPDARFGVILADPEWKFETWSENGMDRSADNHYPCSETGVIMDRKVGNLAADDCVLFLWATAPMLPEALSVMNAWGFKYKSHAIWAKDRIGTGYWFRNQHELLLIGTRGNVPCPSPGTQWASIIDAPIGRHSEKPVKVYELIEGYFPTLPKIELNARNRRDGWDSWGLEAPENEVAA